MQTEELILALAANGGHVLFATMVAAMIFKATQAEDDQSRQSI